MNSILSFKSLIKMLNKNEPSTDPWGTPLVTRGQLDAQVLLAALFVDQHDIQQLPIIWDLPREPGLLVNDGEWFGKLFCQLSHHPRIDPILSHGLVWIHMAQQEFLECIDDNMLLQVKEEPTRRGAMLDLVLTNKVGLVGNVKLKGSLGCSDNEMVEFEILRARRRMHSKFVTLGFRRANFGLFRGLLGRAPWDIALEGRGAQESWLIFKDNLFRAQL
ncbi:glycerol kinase [Pitangus sulphuratus]|nr:glycerol kinase [Pitangus sulphuratus]